jgi:pachytene checkpoint protein 2
VTTGPSLVEVYRLPDSSATFLVDWRTVIVAESLKRRLLDYVDTLARLRGIAAQDLGLRRALLLYGPPGCGKTSLARGLPALWQQQRKTRAGFVHVNTHALFSGERGGGQSRMLSLFRQIEELASADGTLFVLIDEVETLGSDRSAISMEANPLDALYQVTVFLESLDRCVRQTSNVIFVFTTNIPRAIDRAVRERVDFALEVPAPGDADRSIILGQTVAALGSAFDVRPLRRMAEGGEPEWQELVAGTNGFSGRALRHIAVLAATHAATSKELTVEHFSRALHDTHAAEDGLLASGGIYIEKYQRKAANR